MVDRMIELQQSRIQDFLKRLHDAAWHSAYLLASALFGVALGIPSLVVAPIVAGYFLVAILFSAWLFIFNREPFIPAYAVQLTDTGISMLKYGEKVGGMPWADMEDYSVTFMPPRRIRIRSRDGDKLHIEYYALAKSQRDTLLSELRRHKRSGMM